LYYLLSSIKLSRKPIQIIAQSAKLVKARLK